VSNPRVSVVVTAGSAPALDETLWTCAAQTLDDWEVLVVGAPLVLARMAARYAGDSRIRGIELAGGNAGAARNAGLAAARAEWVLFVAAGDGLAPGALERLLDATHPDDADDAPDAPDAVHCGWISTSPVGTASAVQLGPEAGDLFAAAAWQQPFPVHACLVRSRLVRETGGFDESLQVHSAWDLWQRIARGGGRFRRLEEALAVRGTPARDEPAADGGARDLAEALLLIERGHGADPRVQRPAPAHAAGRPRALFAAAAYGAVVSHASRRLGRGDAAAEVLALAPAEPPADLDGDAVAAALFEGMAAAAGIPTESWVGLWPQRVELVDSFLAELEARTGLAGLARDVGGKLERLVLTHANFADGGDATSGPLERGPLFAGRSAVLKVATSEPMAAVDVGSGIDRLLFRVDHSGREIGVVELPGGAVAAEAIAGEVQALVARTESGRPPAPAAAGGAPARPRFDRDYFERIFTADDPWSLDSDYERVKAARTLSLLPAARPRQALEVGCAAGHFTAELARHVDHLLAVDVAERALALARARCAGRDNVRFEHLDVRQQAPAGPFDLVVVGELLHYLPDRNELDRVVGRLLDALAPGGHLLTTHALSIVDEPARTGFDWGCAFGGEQIARTIAATPETRHVRGIRTPLYRVDLFRKLAPGDEPASGFGEVRELPLESTLSPPLALQVAWGPEARDARGAWRLPLTSEVPILAYHRIADGAEPALAEWCVRPEQLEAQLGYLEEAGYKAITLAELRLALESHRPLPEGSLLLTFDDGYADFRSTAAPLLLAHGFSATVFLVTDLVGGVAEWDRALGDPAPLMSWTDVSELAALGFSFGSHGASHRKLSRLSVEAVREEGNRSRDAIAKRLGRAPIAICCPHGDGGGLVGHALAACGYQLGFLGGERVCRTTEHPMAVPRLTVRRDDDMTSFRRKLGEAADRSRSGWRTARAAVSAGNPVVLVELDAWRGEALDAANAPFLSAAAPLRRRSLLAPEPATAAANTPAVTRWAPLLCTLRDAGAEGLWIDPPPSAAAPALALAQLEAGLAAGDPRLVVLRIAAGEGAAELPLPAADALVAQALAALNRRFPRLDGFVLAGHADAVSGRPYLAFGEAAAHEPAVDEASLVARVCALAGLPAQDGTAVADAAVADPAAAHRLSVVIPTYERDRQLARLLDTLERQTLFTVRAADFEVVIVVDGSSDGTLDSLERRRSEWQERGVRLRVLEQANQGAAAARNRGVLAADGDVVLFLDDDLLAAPDVLQHHLDFHESWPALAHACLGNVDWSGDDSTLGRYLWGSNEYLDWKHVCERDHDDVGAGAFWTGQLSLKRRFLLGHGLFDAAAFGTDAGEDLELGRRLERVGLVLHFRPQSVTRLQERFELASLARRQRMKGWSARTLATHGLGAQWTTSAIEGEGLYSARALEEIVAAVAAFEAAQSAGDSSAGRDFDRIYAAALRYAALVGGAEREGVLREEAGAIVSLLHWTALVEASVGDLWTAKDREIDELGRIWHDKDQQLRAAERRCGEQEARFARAQIELDDLRARLALALRVRGPSGEPRHAYRELKQRLEATEQQLRDAELRLAEAGRIWRDRDANLAAADRMWREKDRQLAEAERIWREKDRQLADAQAEREWLLSAPGSLPPELEGIWREKDRELAAARRAWRERDRQLAEAERTWREKDQQLLAAEHTWRAKDEEAEQIAARLRQIESCRSWRWTAPVRRLGSLLRSGPRLPRMPRESAPSTLPAPALDAGQPAAPPAAGEARPSAVLADAAPGERPRALAAEPVPICTIVSNNYLAFARVLVESYLEHHPGARAFVCVVERTPATLPGAPVPWTVVPVEELEIPGFRNMAFRYDVIELCTAVKPWLLAHLRDRYGLDRVFFFDPDILVLDRLHGLETALETHDAVLTPHVCEPVDVGWRPGERELLRAGTFNLGFIGLRLNASTAAFLEWWQDRLRRFCIVDIPGGLFVDQLWMNLAPAYLSSLEVTREPIYNVAWWNLAQRRLGVHDGRFTVGGRPLGFYHFSGLDLRRPGLISKHREDLTLAKRPDVRPLLDHYRTRLEAAGNEELRASSYGYARFADTDVPIPGPIRRTLHRLDPLGRRWPDPFDTHDADSFLGWLTEPLEFPAGALNRAALAVWEDRPDVAIAFPRVCDEDLPRFVDWLTVYGEGARAGFTPALLDGIRAYGRRQKDSLAEALAGFVAPYDGDAEYPSLPFASLDFTAPGELLGWLNQVVPGAAKRRPRLTNLAMMIHQVRPDLQRQFPDPLGADQLEYATWFSAQAGAEYAMHADLQAAVLRSLPFKLRRAARRQRRDAERGGFVMTDGLAAVAPARGDGDVATAGAPARDAASATAAARRAWPRGVNLAAYFSADSGVAQVGRGAAHALVKSGFPFVRVPLDQHYTETVVARRVHNPEGAPYPVTLLHANASEASAVVATLPLAAGRTGVRIGYWFWELAHFPLGYASAFALFDEIWAASSFSRAAFEAISPVPVRLVPPCVPAPRWVAPQAARAELGLDDERFYFFFAFDARSVPERKNPRAAIEALGRYLARGERPRRDVGLLLKLQEAERQPELVDALRKAASGLPVTFLDGATDREGVERMLAASDAVLSLHRSEGLGLLPIEAMQLGKPVIATGYGGVCDFLDEESGFPVRYRLVPLGRDHGPYPQGAVWAEPDLDHAVEQMMRVVAGALPVERRVRVARARVEERYGVEAAGRRYGDALAAIFDGFGIGEPGGAEAAPAAARRVSALPSTRPASGG
jgi:glycosyltransferase involved in cell wall biosynthesis/peptidoglycan/xylan/chitin deacetylase (PgdA/CDA1 family)/2-polyprenyl-3-methyl-5-hydroxy-6-metoxy-1,4-benzoquinol methylase